METRMTTTIIAIKNFRFIFIVLLLSVFAFADSPLLAQDNRDETVYFMDGTIVRGRIVEIDKDRIRIQ